MSGIHVKNINADGFYRPKDDTTLSIDAYEIFIGNYIASWNMDDYQNKVAFDLPLMSLNFIERKQLQMSKLIHCYGKNISYNPSHPFVLNIHFLDETDFEKIKKYIKILKERE